MACWSSGGARSWRAQGLDVSRSAHKWPNRRAATPVIRKLGLSSVRSVMTNMPAAEVDVDEALVRRLLAEQCPELVGRPLRLVAFGWDNVVYRLGDDLVVRLPRRQIAAALIEHEQGWLPQLAMPLPLPIPAPVFPGRPGSGYPWNWSVTPWFDGEDAL